MVKPEGATLVVRRKKCEKPNKKKMATVAAVHACAPRPRARTPTDLVTRAIFGASVGGREVSCVAKMPESVYGPRMSCTL